MCVKALMRYIDDSQASHSTDSVSRHLMLRSVASVAPIQARAGAQVDTRVRRDVSIASGEDAAWPRPRVTEPVTAETRAAYPRSRRETSSDHSSPRTQQH